MGRKALALKCDVTKEADLMNFVERAIVEFGKLNILVNNWELVGEARKIFSGDGGIFRTYFQGKCVQCLEIVPVGRTLYETGWLWFDSEHYFHGKYQPESEHECLCLVKSGIESHDCQSGNGFRTRRTD